MKFTVLTLFPEIFEMYLSQTILKRAIDKDKVNYNIVNIRDFAYNKHHQMDDTPFGGGAGMVLKPEAYWNFFSENYNSFYFSENNIENNSKNIDISQNNDNLEKKDNLLKPYVIFLTPQGKKLNHKKVVSLLEKEEIILISGRYEGLDQRVIDKFVDEEISIGDYVLSSGDLPALVLIDSITRINEGVIKKESFETDSFFNGLLGFPQYTRPIEIDGYSVPEVLRNGNHSKIDEFRKYHSIKKTSKNRSDLIEEKLKKDENFQKEYEKFLKNKNNF